MATERYKPPYRLEYLRTVDYEVYNARPCHYCCFGGARLECQGLCKSLGQRALFLKNDTNCVQKYRHQLRVLRQRVDGEIRAARSKSTSTTTPKLPNIITNYEDF